MKFQHKNKDMNKIKYLTTFLNYETNGCKTIKK